MSCDFGLWYSRRRLRTTEAEAVYAALCEGDLQVVDPHPGIDTFYAELTGIHPEIDDLTEEDVDNLDLCPWSVGFDRSPGHLIICSVWSRAEYVRSLLRDLAAKHGLILFDPQTATVTHPGDPAERPWWRFW